jgi:hypothetical protein
MIHYRYCAILLVALLTPLGGAAVLVPSALAQAKQADRQLIARLDELTRQKGIKNNAVGSIVCRTLGLQPIGDCEVYHSAFKEPGEAYGHAFNSYDEPGTGLRRVLIYAASQEHSEVYLVAADGRLQRAAVKRGSVAKGTAVWTLLALEQAAPGFKKEIDYWRRQQHILAKESDRKD